MQYRACYAFGVATLLAVFVDEAFLEAYARELGAIDCTVAIEVGPELSRTELQMTVPTNGVPALFKRLVTPTVEITEVRHWPTSPDAAEKGSFAVDAAVGRRTARVHGALSLAAVAEHETTFSAHGDIDVRVPFGRGVAVSLINDLVTRCLEKQTKVLKSWIVGPQGG